MIGDLLRLQIASGEVEEAGIKIVHLLCLRLPAAVRAENLSNVTGLEL